MFEKIKLVGGTYGKEVGLTILFQLTPDFGLGAAKATDDHRANWVMFGPLHVLTISEFGHGTICITRLANADEVVVFNNRQCPN